MNLWGIFFIGSVLIMVTGFMFIFASLEEEE